MRFPKNYCWIFFMLIASAQCTNGQNWLWEQAAYTYSGDARSTGIASDSVGNAYLSIDLWSGNNISFGPFNAKTLGFNNICVVKYSPLGNVLWMQGPSYSSYAFASSIAICTDKQNNVCVAGQFMDTLAFGMDTIKSNQGTAGFLTKYDQNGNVQWVQGDKVPYMTSYIKNVALCCDNSNNIYAGGGFCDTAEIGSYKIISGPFLQSNMYLVKYTANGAVSWVRTAKGGSYLYSVSTDNYGHVYVTGNYGTYINLSGIILTSIAYANNFFIAKYDTAGNIIWAKSASSVYGGGVYPASTTVDKYGSIYATGFFYDTVTFGSYMLHNPPATAFIVKYDTAGNVIWAKSTSANNEAYGTSLSADRWGNIYWGGQLYDSLTFNGLSISINDIPNNESTYIIKMDTSGHPLCGTTITYSGLCYLAANPLAQNVYYEGDADNSFCLLTNTTISALGDFWALTGKWDCNPCKISASISGNTTICRGENVLLKGSGGTIKGWSTGSTYDTTIVSPSITTTYTLYVTNGTCSGDTTITINVNPLPNIQFNNYGKICLGKMDTITASGGSTYTWSNGETSSTIIVSPTITTSYIVTASNGLCSAKDSTTVKVFQYPVASISNTQFICQGQAASISAKGGTSYVWNTGDITSAITVQPSSNTSYTVNISNGYCSVQDSTTIMVNPLPNINICCDSLITRGEAVQLMSSGGTTYSWYPAEWLSCDACANPISTPSSNITYTVTITSDSGCVAAKTVTIDVSCGDVFIPDIFSPNQSFNNVLYVRGTCISSMDFIVFDRWGNKLFESQTPKIGWDGDYNGIPMNMGTYVWHLKANMNDGTTIEKNGNVTLLR